MSGHYGLRTLQYIGREREPFGNLALELYLLERTKPGEIVLFLWQNERTVVIGRNQNCWRECRVNALEADGGTLARRYSGGGAVYHDAGNLNFTFLTAADDFNVARQSGVILSALRMLGIPAAASGRNDLTVEGKKCSGSAFYRKGGSRLHHGTLLVHTDFESMVRYLSVPADKLGTHGVASVKARVMNLCEANPALTTELLSEKLLRAFAEEYGQTPAAIPDEGFDRETIRALGRRFALDEWRYGREISYSCELSRRFSWGGLQLQLDTADGVIREAAVYSDALDEELIAALPDALRGCPLQRSALEARLSGLGDSTICLDLMELLEQNLL